MKVLVLDQIASVNYKYSFSLANALKDAGAQVEMVIDTEADASYCRCPVTRRFSTARKDIGKLRKALNYLSAWRFVYKKAVREGFDVVHLQWFDLSPADAYFIRKLRKKGVHPVAGVHDILPMHQKRFDPFFYRLIYRFCDRIYVQAQANVARFSALFPEDKQKLSLIPHGHFLDFAAPVPKAQARKALGIPEDRTVFLFFGQIKKVKGLDLLLSAFGSLQQKRSDLFLIVAGNVWKDDFSVYQEQINRLGLQDDCLRADIRYIPEEELSLYFSASDLCVLPYRDVYQSGVLQLVYAYEKPPVASRIPSFLELVREGETGYLFDVGSEESLSLALERAAGDRERWAALGRRGQALVRQALSWDRIAGQVLALYKEAIDAPKERQRP